MADLLPDWASGILSTISADAGFDLSGVANAFLGGGSASQPQTPGIVPSSLGFGFNIGGPTGITIGSSPSPSTPGGTPFGPVGAGLPGGSSPAPSSSGGVGISYHSIRDKMFAHLGFRPRRKTVMYLIRTLGFAVASAVLGLDINDVLFLFMKRRHSSRRHYVQTMIKWVRKGERARKTLGKYHVPHARRSSNFGQRMAAHRRRKRAA